MKILKTPENNFDFLKDYDFLPNYQNVSLDSSYELQMHYLDENSSSDHAILLLHGEPTWSYLYRKFIPPLVERGKRVIAPDLIGFGKSDKFQDQSAYSYANHLEWLRSLVNALNLKDVVMFAQDWGGLLGLRLVAENPCLFKGMVLSNTGLPTGKGMTDGFKQWLGYSQNVEDFDAGKIVNQGSMQALSNHEIAAYNAPFPSDKYKAAARAFPRLVPVTEEHAQVSENIDAWHQLKKFTKPTLTMFGKNDPVFIGTESALIKKIPGADGMPHQIIDAGHFSQENQAEILVNGILSIS